MEQAESNFILVELWEPRLHADDGDSLSLSLFCSFISAARMHARFNNAGSSMRSQRVVSFLTSTRTLFHPSLHLLLLLFVPRFILLALSAMHRCGASDMHKRARICESTVCVFLFPAKRVRNVSRHVRRIHTEIPLSAFERGSARRSAATSNSLTSGYFSGSSCLPLPFFCLSCFSGVFADRSLYCYQCSVARN